VVLWVGGGGGARGGGGGAGGGGGGGRVWLARLADRGVYIDMKDCQKRFADLIVI